MTKLDMLCMDKVGIYQIVGKEEILPSKTKQHGIIKEEGWL
jgi:hypothetical protein